MNAKLKWVVLLRIVEVIEFVRYGGALWDLCEF